MVLFTGSIKLFLFLMVIKAFLYNFIHFRALLPLILPIRYIIAYYSLNL